MTEVLGAYETVMLKSNVHYCVICFRTSSERRLMKPNALQNVLKYINNNEYKLESKYQLLCYMCSRQAMAASKVLRAVNLSDKLHQLFDTLSNNKAVSDELYAYVHNWKQSKTKKKLLEPKNIEEWERSLLSVRSQTMLLQTEVLMLNTELKEYPPPPPIPPPATISSPILSGILHNFTNSTSITDLTDDNIHNNETDPPVRQGSHEQSVLAEPEIYMDSVVILDEDDPIEVPKEERPDTPLLVPDSPPSNIPIISDTTNLGACANQQSVPFNITVPSMNFQSAPVFNKTPNSSLNLQNGSLYGPISMLKVQNTPLNVPKPILLPNSALNIKNASLNLQTPHNYHNAVLLNPEMVPIIENAGKSVMLHPILDKNGMMTVPTLSANIVNGQLIIMNNSNTVMPVQVEKPIKVTKNQNIQKPQEVKSLDRKKEYRRSNAKIKEADVILLDDVQESARSKNEREVKRRKQDIEVAPMVVRRRETDWEDKIPMDVISFMDATDPNADALLRSGGPVKPLTHSMGVISDVRSITDDPILPG